jgi:ABC-type multidrug transport system ATPase subunit
MAINSRKKEKRMYLAAVKLSGVSKRYGSLTAVDYLDLEVKRGEILGLLGPNGSGKSTTLKMILDWVSLTLVQ